MNISSAQPRAWGMPGAQRTHSLACENENNTRVSHHRFIRKHPTFPHAMVTTYSVISPAIRFLTPSLTDLRQLDAAAEASGPHALAVRCSTFRQARRTRPPH